MFFGMSSPPKKMWIQRIRSNTPPRSSVTIETEGGYVYEKTEKRRRQSKQQVQAAERRREKDTVKTALAGQLVKRRPGRPPKGKEGPQPGSLRFVAQHAGGLLSTTALRRAGKQLEEADEVRDQRKHNGSTAELSCDQEQTLLTMMHDDWEKRQHIDYDKIRRFAVLLQIDEDICEQLDVEAVDEDAAWVPSNGWIAGYCKKWGISSHKAQAKESSRSRPTMKAEEEWVDANYKKFPGCCIVVCDESGFMWGAVPLRTMADSDGLGAYIATDDKRSKWRTTLLIALRMTDDSETQVLATLCIPSHSCTIGGRSCPLSLPTVVADDDWPCDCATRKVAGLHDTHWQYMLGVWLDGDSGMYCVLHTVHTALCQYTVHCTPYTAHCTLHTVHHTPKIVHRTLYTVHCTLYTVH